VNIVGERCLAGENVYVINKHQLMVDSDNVEEAVLARVRSIERGDGAELQTEDDLRRYFEDIVQRGKNRRRVKPYVWNYIAARASAELAIEFVLLK
jgi:hypothetical protein